MKTTVSYELTDFVCSTDIINTQVNELKETNSIKLHSQESLNKMWTLAINCTPKTIHLLAIIALQFITLLC